MEIEIRDSYEELDKDLVVDEQNCVVKGVKIIGNMTNNGFAYPREARIRSHEVFRTAKCNWGHHKEVPPDKRFGWYTNVRECPLSDCTRADLHYVRDHEHASQFVSTLKANPDLLGISIYGRAKGTGQVDSAGRKIVESFARVSLDIVADNGGGFGLRDSMDAALAADKETDYGAEGCVKAITDIIAAGGDARAIVTAIEAHIAKLKEIEGGGEEEVETKDALKARKECLELCDRLQVKEPDETFLSLLAHVAPAEREPVVKQYQRGRGAKPPRSGTTMTQVRDQAAPDEDWETKMTRLAGVILTSF